MIGPVLTVTTYASPGGTSDVVLPEPTVWFSTPKRTSPPPIRSMYGSCQVPAGGSVIATPFFVIW